MDTTKINFYHNTFKDFTNLPLWQMYVYDKYNLCQMYLYDNVIYDKQTFMTNVPDDNYTGWGK